MSLLLVLPLLAACQSGPEHFKEAERIAPVNLTEPCVAPMPLPTAAKDDVPIFVWALDAERRAYECKRTHEKLVRWINRQPEPAE